MIKTGAKIKIIANTCQEGRSEFLGKCGTLIKVDPEDRAGLVYKIQLDDEPRYCWFKHDEVASI